MQYVSGGSNEPKPVASLNFWKPHTPIPAHTFPQRCTEGLLQPITPLASSQPEKATNISHAHKMVFIKYSHGSKHLTMRKYESLSIFLPASESGYLRLYIINT